MNDRGAQTDNSTLFLICKFFPKTHDKIRTEDFLHASHDVVFLIEHFGKVFSSITYDMRINIQKLTRKYEEDPNANMHLEDILLAEESTENTSGTEAVMWLKRDLYFISTLFSLIIEDSYRQPPATDLGPLLKKAYTDTLENHHGWMGVQLFNILARFMPQRKQFMYTLAVDRYNCEDMVLIELEKYNDHLAATVQNLTEFNVMNGFEPLHE